ncbi:MAG: hypothetical protein IKM64_02370 [Clostridia bacterium]|nr:hypothetical protein [Clostridia bacterium]
MKMKQWTEKLKGIQPMTLMIALVLLCLFLYFSPAESAGGMTDAEKRISRTLSMIKGAGKCSVSIWYQQENSPFSSDTGQPSGVLILSPGARDMTVRLQLTQAASTLLGIEESRVAIYQMEENE